MSKTVVAEKKNGQQRDFYTDLPKRTKHENRDRSRDFERGDEGPANQGEGDLKEIGGT